MISSTLGAPFGGTTVGGQYGLDCSEPRLISPANFGGGGGRYFPSIVSVALGAPGKPLIFWAPAGAKEVTIAVSATNANVAALMGPSLQRLTKSLAAKSGHIPIERPRQGATASRDSAT